MAESHLTLHDFFASRDCVIATMHHKEAVIAPILEADLGVKTQVPSHLNTDTFGTFTREIDRPADQITTARLKAQQAMDQVGATLGVASEGSFGPHPASPLIPCNREIVILCDREHDLEVWGEVLSTQTNFASQQVRTLKEAQAFAQQVGFPCHGLVVRSQPSGMEPDRIQKGITTEAELIQTLETLLQDPGVNTIQLETDMRAMVNPTRMQVITQATTELIRKLQNQCPACHYPGFDVSHIRKGLPCGLCGIPTPNPKAYLYTCKHCHHEQEVLFPLGQETADPSTCFYCNP